MAYIDVGGQDPLQIAEVESMARVVGALNHLQNTSKSPLSTVF